MEAFQERVVAEKQELDDKLNKLGAFIDGNVFGGLLAAEQDLMRSQATHMRSYSDVLAARIKSFAGSEKAVTWSPVPSEGMDVSGIADGPYLVRAEGQQTVRVHMFSGMWFRDEDGKQSRALMSFRPTEYAAVKQA